MFRIIAALIASLALCSQAAAQSSYFPAASTPGAPANPNVQSSELLGVDANGNPVNLTTTSTFTGCTSLGTTATNWAGFTFYLGSASSSTTRYGLRLYTDAGCTTTLVQDIYVDGSSGGSMHERYMPLNVTSGTTIYAAATSASGSNIRVAVRGDLKDVNSPPMFNTMTVISTVDTTNRTPSSVDIPLTGAWTSQLTTAGACGAILADPHRSATTPATAQFSRLKIGVGASPTLIHEYSVNIANSTAPFPKIPGLLMQRQFPSGTQIQAAATADTPGSDTIRVGLYCFN